MSMSNSAPEKIYLDPALDALTKALSEKTEDDVEYIRTDAFMDKVAIWFNNKFVVHDEYGVISDSFDTKEEMFENFRKFMKGENE